MSNTCKYTKQQKQFSTNSGETWSNVIPFEYRRGGLIEADSPDCREEVMITRFVTIPDAFLCDGKDKYERQVAQYSLDNGASWQYYYPSIYQYGNLIESNADICNNKWEGYYSGDTANICSNGYTYVAGRGCVGGRGGGHCRIGLRGCMFDPVKYVRCSSTTSTTLTRNDINYPPYTVYEGHIGDCVTSIENNTFDSYTSLSSVTIGSGVTSIGNYAFTKCTSLSSITIPSSVTSIGERCFYDCSGLTSVTMLNSATSIGELAFLGCSSLVSVNMESGVTSIGTQASIGRQAFWNCQSLASLTIGGGITSIETHAFSNCASLTSVTLPDSVVTIGGGAFSNCSGATSLTIGSSVTSIGDSAFENCSGLVSVTIPNNVTSMGVSVFGGCSGLTSLTIGNGVTSIGNNSFSGCTNLTSVVIPSGVTSIGNYAFTNCTSLSSITIESAIPPSFGSNAFTNTNNCTFYVPCESVNTYKTTSGWVDFASRIQGIPPCAPTPTGGTKWIATYSGGTTSSGVCDGSVVLRNGEITKSNLISVEIGDCVTSIDREAFYYCSSLTSVTIPNSVTSIGASAFGSCSGMTSVTIPDSVNYIGILAFGGCWGLTSVIIGSGITTLDNYAFEHCDGLNSITIHATTPPTLGWDVFSNTNNCPIYVPCGCVTAYKAYWSQYSSRITEIPDSCYKYLATYSGGTTSSAACDTNNNVIESGDVVTNDLTSVIIGDCVIEIGDYAFYNCSALTSVTCIANLPAALPPSIGTDVFGGTTPNNMVIYVPYLSEDDYKLSMPEYASRIQGIPETKWVGTYLDSHKEARACDGSLEIGRGDVNTSNLLTLKIGDCATSIGTSAFTRCNSLTSVTIPDSVTSIGQHAFEQSMGLTSINIPNSVTSIGFDAFRLCYSLTSVTIGNSVASIGGGTFEWCSGLTSVTVLATTPPTLGRNVFSNTSANLVIYVPCESVEAYKSTYRWSDYASRIVGIPPCEEPYLSRTSSANGYVPLGEYFQENTVIDIDFQLTNTDGFAVIGDYFQNDRDDWRFCLGAHNTSNKQVLYDFDANRLQSALSSNFNRYHWEIGNYYIKDLDTNNYVVSGSPHSNFTRPNQMFLFHMEGTTSQQNLDYGNVYSIKIYQNGVLAKDFKPWTDGNGNYGLYDLVDGNVHNSVGQMTGNTVSNIS